VTATPEPMFDLDTTRAERAVADVRATVADRAARTALATNPALDVFVPGKPAAQGSKRYLGPGRPPIEQSKAVKPWRADVRAAAQAARTGPPLDGPIVLVVEFVMPRPTSTPKSRTPPAVKRPDIDKQCRAVCDALSGLAWKDDSQIVDLHATKRIAELDEGPGARIRVWAGVS